MGRRGVSFLEDGRDRTDCLVSLSPNETKMVLGNIRATTGKVAVKGWEFPDIDGNVKDRAKCVKRESNRF